MSEGNCLHLKAHCEQVNTQAMNNTENLENSALRISKLKSKLKFLNHPHFQSQNRDKQESKCLTNNTFNENIFVCL